MQNKNFEAAWNLYLGKFDGNDYRAIGIWNWCAGT